MQNEPLKTQTIRATGVAIFTQIKESGKSSFRKLADLINGSKSSVRRHLKAQKNRALYPNHRCGKAPRVRVLVFATLYVFCLGRGVGTDQISLFFKLIRIDKYVGISASALQQLVKQMEMLLPLFQDVCEKSKSNHEAHEV